MPLDTLNAGLAVAIAYLFGSIPFGLILTRLAGLGDIRKVGSGNIGATNVLRTGNKAVAAATLLGDMLKGTAGVLAGGALAGPTGALLGAMAAFIGHLYPVWLGFKGGKGVATYIGILIGIHWPAALVFCATWLAVAAASRYSSLSALVASVLAPVSLALMSQPCAALVSGLLTVLVFVRHRENIRRLVAGEETRIGGKA